MHLNCGMIFIMIDEKKMNESGTKVVPCGKCYSKIVRFFAAKFQLITEISLDHFQLSVYLTLWTNNKYLHDHNGLVAMYKIPIYTFIARLL